MDGITVLMSVFIHVVTVYSQLNAMANRAAGKGYENEDHYTNLKLQFIGIENIHVMRNSQQRIVDSKSYIIPQYDYVSLF